MEEKKGNIKYQWYQFPRTNYNIVSNHFFVFNKFFLKQFSYLYFIACWLFYHRIISNNLTEFCIYEVYLFIFLLKRNTDCRLMILSFNWNGGKCGERKTFKKKYSTIFVGTSPELEIGIYTLCYLFGRKMNFMNLGPYNVIIRVNKVEDRIKSIYPVAR